MGNVAFFFAMQGQMLTRTIVAWDLTGQATSLAYIILVVAIPMTLLYAILNTRSKSIVYILQEQAAGVIAERAEAHSAAANKNEKA